MTKRKKQMIGYDPLAWLKDDADDEPVSAASPVKSEQEKSLVKKTTSEEKTIASVNMQSDKTSQAVEQPVRIIESQDMNKNATSSDNNDSQQLLCIKLESNQNIAQVAELHEQLCATTGYSELVINAESVERIDAASLQLLCALFIEAEKYEFRITWQNPSVALTDSAGLLGLKSRLSLE